MASLPIGSDPPSVVGAPSISPGRLSTRLVRPALIQRFGGEQLGPSFVIFTWPGPELRCFQRPRGAAQKLLQIVFETIPR